MEAICVQLLGSISRLPTDYGTRLTRFFQAYLGTETQPVPFGGRETQMEALDAWLADADAPPYALLAAPSGRGKSALLVRWAARLLAQGEVEVIFIPVSRRFHTALASVVFTALAARLAEVQGELVQWEDRSAEQWRDLCRLYLSRTPPDGKRVVIILDGLDEAVDWELEPTFFPHPPLPGVRVLLSAREGTLLNWTQEETARVQRITLPPLRCGWQDEHDPAFLRQTPQAPRPDEYRRRTAAG